MMAADFRSRRNVVVTPRAPDYDDQLAALRRAKGLSDPVSSDREAEWEPPPAPPTAASPAAEPPTSEPPMSRTITRTCAKCGDEFTFKHSRGRPATLCPDCRGGKAAVPIVQRRAPRAAAVVAPARSNSATHYRRRLAEIERELTVYDRLVAERDALQHLIEIVEPA